MIILYNLLINRYIYFLQILIDSRANGFVFINQTTTID
jgi:hypothetical protein